MWWSSVRNVGWRGWRAFNPALLSRLLTVLVLAWTLRFCHCWQSSEQGVLGSRTADRTSTPTSAAEESIGLPGLGLSVTSLVWWYFAINKHTWLWFIPICLAITVCVWPASHITIKHQWSLLCRVWWPSCLLANLIYFCTWGYPKKIVSHMQYISFQQISMLLLNHWYAGQVIPYFTNYLRCAFFLIFANFRKCAKFLARSILSKLDAAWHFIFKTLSVLSLCFSHYMPYQTLMCWLYI